LADHLHAIAVAHDAKRVSGEKESVGYLVGLLTWVFCGGTFVAAKAVVAEMPPWTLVFFRLLIATLVLLPFVAAHRHAMLDFARKRWPEALFIGAIGLGITQGMMFTSLQFTSAVTCGIIFATTPIITLVLARIILGEPLGPWQALGSLVAFGGIVVIAVQGSFATLIALDFSAGDLIILAAAAVFAGYTVLLKRAKFELERLPLLVVLLCGGIIACLPFYLYELFDGQHANLGINGYLALAYVAIPGGALMYLLYNWSVDILGAGRAGSLLYSQMIFTAILAWFFLNEPIELYHIAGAALIIAGVVLITVLKPKASPIPS
jgi:drug/metabolite transporter (DMT)-like permease